MARPKVVVLGGINIDLIALTSRLPVPGETVAGEDFYTTPGGKGGNQAVAAARLGAEVSMVGRVGGDIFGPGLLADLRKEGIDVSGVTEDPERASGVAVIILNAERQNHIVAAYGANAACDEDQLVAARRAVVGADALLLQQEIPVEVSRAAAEFARSKGVRVFWDPAPARDLPDEAYAEIDVLTPNQTEAAAITGVDVVDVASAERAAIVILGKGVATAVVKLGEQGVYYASEGDAGHVQAFTVQAVDTVAAGDAFGSAVVVALIEGRSLGEAVRFGAAAGALAVTKAGAQAAMPTREEVESLLASG
jgi:ribokinase